MNFLVKGHSVDPWDPHTFLVVELILEVLDVEVLELCRHALDLIEQLVVFVVHGDDALLDHVVQVELVDFFQS